MWTVRHWRGHLLAEVCRFLADEGNVQGQSFIRLPDAPAGFAPVLVRRHSKRAGHPPPTMRTRSPGLQPSVAPRPLPATCIARRSSRQPSHGELANSRCVRPPNASRVASATVGNSGDGGCGRSKRDFGRRIRANRIGDACTVARGQCPTGSSTPRRSGDPGAPTPSSRRYLGHQENPLRVVGRVVRKLNLNTVAGLRRRQRFRHARRRAAAGPDRTKNGDRTEKNKSGACQCVHIAHEAPRQGSRGVEIGRKAQIGNRPRTRQTPPKPGEKPRPGVLDRASPRRWDRLPPDETDQRVAGEIRRQGARNVG